MRIVVPMPPNLANSRLHWRTKHREKQDYWLLCDLTYRNPKPPFPAMPKATIRSTMYLGAAMDQDNAMARHKWALDWLKEAGYIADDRKKCLEWTGFPEQVVKRGQRYRIELELEAA